MATDVATARARALRAFHDGDALLTALRAARRCRSSPGQPVTTAAGEYLDASLTEPIPVPAAEADGYTHVLVLLTRPIESRARARRWFDRCTCCRDCEAPVAGAGAAVRRSRRAVRRVAGGIAAGRGPGGRAQVLRLRPEPPAVDRLETDATLLRSAAARRLRRGDAAFST